MHRSKIVGVLAGTAVLLLGMVGVSSAVPTTPPQPASTTGSWIVETAPGKIPVAKTHSAITPMDTRGSTQPVFGNYKTVWSASCAGTNPREAFSRLSVCTGLIG